MKYNELLLEKKFPMGQGLNPGALFFHLSVLIFPLLKDKLRHITFLRVYLRKNRFELGSIKPDVVRSASPLIEAWVET